MILEFTFTPEEAKAAGERYGLRAALSGGLLRAHIAPLTAFFLGMLFVTVHVLNPPAHRGIRANSRGGGVYGAALDPAPTHVRGAAARSGLGRVPDGARSAFARRFGAAGRRNRRRRAGVRLAARGDAVGLAGAGGPRWRVSFRRHGAGARLKAISAVLAALISTMAAPAARVKRTLLAKGAQSFWRETPRTRALSPFCTIST